MQYVGNGPYYKNYLLTTSDDIILNPSNRVVTSERLNVCIKKNEIEGDECSDCIYEEINNKLIDKVENKIQLVDDKDNKIKLIDDYGIDGDFIESQAFAFLAIRSFLNLPISFNSTTGCKDFTVGGKLVKNF